MRVDFRNVRDSFETRKIAVKAAIDGWQANPHNYGPGKLHKLEGDKTLCGKTLVSCPGRLVEGTTWESITCIGCQNKARSDRERAESNARWEQEQAEREAAREAENEEWWRAYDEYRKSPGWYWRRDAVLERDGALCQGCRKRRAAII